MNPCPCHDEAMATEETCPMCDDTGFELSTDPEAFCTLCARGLGVARRSSEPENEDDHA